MTTTAGSVLRRLAPPAAALVGSSMILLGPAAYAAPATSTPSHHHHHHRHHHHHAATSPAPAPGTPGSPAPGSAPPAAATPVPPPSSSAGATVNVSSAAQLSAALASAAAGETIVLAPGTYPGQFTATASGTATAPITLTGPSTAVLDGGTVTNGYTLHLAGASWWHLVGFSVVHGQKGVMLDGSDNDVLSGLDVSHIGDEAVHFRRGSSYDTIQNSTVHDTGLHAATFGEGIYFGSASHNWVGGQPDTSNYDRAIGDTVYNTTAENIDTKEGTTGGLIQDNHLDGAGSTAADAWIDVKGNGYRVLDNVGVHAGAQAPAAGAETFVLYPGYGNGNLFEGNRWSFAPGSAAYGFEINGGTGNVVSCDNTSGGSAALANIACTP